MDNLRVHKTLEVTETCKQLHAKPIFNVPYIPNFNGIENYFNLVKAEYKKLILQKLVKGIKPDVTATIHQSIASVQKEKVRGPRPQHDQETGQGAGPGVTFKFQALLGLQKTFPRAIQSFCRQPVILVQPLLSSVLTLRSRLP